MNQGFCFLGNIRFQQGHKGPKSKESRHLPVTQEKAGASPVGPASFDGLRAEAQNNLRTVPIKHRWE